MRDGTGKEVMARLIHASSRRSSGPFVAVNMAAIPESLADAELFGYVRGAFTGADKSRVGRFLSAHQGTLFLDEIGEMPLDLQAKLLRVLQDREVTPWAARTNPRRVRVIAARIAPGRHGALGPFRDLFYRRGVPIDVPPLRARRDDVCAADHFLGR